MIKITLLHITGLYYIFVERDTAFEIFYLQLTLDLFKVVERGCSLAGNNNIFFRIQKRNYLLTDQYASEDFRILL